jgi:hypothetical protein
MRTEVSQKLEKHLNLLSSYSTQMLVHKTIAGGNMLCGGNVLNYAVYRYSATKQA